MVIPVAKTNFRGQERVFGIKLDDRRRHMYIIGKTGMGKTVFLQNMTIADIEAGNGLAVIDPHGEYAEELLEHIPSHRVNDVIYFNPSDLDYPIAFNAIEKVAPENRHLVASGLMGVFKKIWPDVWSARMEYILNNTILALLEYPNSTLLGIMRMLSNKEYRKKVLEKVTDPVIKAFWLEEYAQYSDKFEKEAIAPIQNKVGQFIAAPIIRNIIGQINSAVNMREIMDTGKILIINLSKGKIGEDSSKLLGGMLVTKLQLAAMSRVDIPEQERRDFYLYVDEFQNFATDSFADILSEARKYRLNLIMAHQYITQLSEEVRDAVFGNVGTLVSFRVGAEDAEFLEKEFTPDFLASDLINLAKTNIYLRLMIDGVASRPFSATTLPPRPRPTKNNKDAIIRVSRERYAKDRKEVEEKISRWASLGGVIIKSGGISSNTSLKTKKPAPEVFSKNASSDGFKPGTQIEKYRDNKGFLKPKVQTFYKPFQSVTPDSRQRTEFKKQEPSINKFNKSIVNKPSVIPQDIKPREIFHKAPDKPIESLVIKKEFSLKPAPTSELSPQPALPNKPKESDQATGEKGEINATFEQPRKKPDLRSNPLSQTDNSQAVHPGAPGQPKTISLKQAFLEKEATSFGQRPVKKEVNRESLKKLIEQSLGELEKEKSKTKNFIKPASLSSTFQKTPLDLTSHRKVLDLSDSVNSSYRQTEKPNQIIIKPGEKIFFNQKKNRT